MPCFYEKAILEGVLTVFFHFFNPLASTSIVYSFAGSIGSDFGFDTSKFKNAVLDFIGVVTELPPSSKWTV